MANNNKTTVFEHWIDLLIATPSIETRILVGLWGRCEATSNTYRRRASAKPLLSEGFRMDADVK